MQQVHFCSGSVFVTGDDIALALLRYVQAVSDVRRSDVVTVPTESPSGEPGAVTLMVNSVSQISADRVERSGSELEDAAFVGRLEAMTKELSAPLVWLGEGDPFAA